MIDTIKFIFRGETFRPCYSILGELRSHLDQASFCALTATCTPRIKQKILDVLHLRTIEIATTAVSPDRPNITLTFVDKHPSDIEMALETYLTELLDKRFSCPKVIIYCRNVRRTGHSYGSLSYTLHKQGVPKAEVRKLISEYHAELYEDQRLRITSEFRKEDSDIRCLVSTVAFGMGIDIPDVVGSSIGERVILLFSIGKRLVGVVATATRQKQ